MAEGARFVCHILDINTSEKRTLPYPIYTVSPDGRTAIGADFRRIHHLRPGCGYGGVPHPNHDVLAPEDSGIYRLDLETGAYELIVTIADVPRIPFPHFDPSGAKHYFDHLLFNTDGSHFEFLEFLHCWKMDDQKSFQTRMLTATPGRTDIHIVDDYGHTSHFLYLARPNPHPSLGLSPVP